MTIKVAQNKLTKIQAYLAAVLDNTAALDDHNLRVGPALTACAVLQRELRILRGEQIQRSREKRKTAARQRGVRPAAASVQE